MPEDPELLWKHPTEHGVSTTAAVVGNRVYAGTLDGELLCLDRSTGEVNWRYRSIESTDPDAFAPGFSSPPTVTEGAVYAGDEDGVLHAVDPETGEKQWTFQTDAQIVGGATVVGENVIVGSHDTFLYCLKAADGSVVWKFQTQDRVNCSPAVVENYTFVAGCDEHLRVIDITDGSQFADIPLGTYLIASPAVPGERLYVGTYASEVVAVDWKAKEIVWRYKDPEREFPYHASAAVTEKYVLVGGRDKQMHCIDRETGEGVWTFPTRAQVDSSPVVVGDRVFFGSSDRTIYGLRISDGNKVWSYRARRPITAGPAVGEGVLVVGAEGSGGHIYCFGEAE